MIFVLECIIDLHMHKNSPRVDFSTVRVERFDVRRSFSHQFEAKKFDVGERRNWIELSMNVAERKSYEKSPPDS